MGGTSPPIVTRGDTPRHLSDARSPDKKKVRGLKSSRNKNGFLVCQCFIRHTMLYEDKYTQQKSVKERRNTPQLPKAHKEQRGRETPAPSLYIYSASKVSLFSPSYCSVTHMCLNKDIMFKTSWTSAKSFFCSHLKRNNVIKWGRMQATFKELIIVLQSSNTRLQVTLTLFFLEISNS